jgi:cytochrome P450
MSLRGKRFLVVDDEPDVGELVRVLLPDSQVDVALTYHDGMVRMAGGSYDAVLLDIMGVDGHVLLRQFAGKYPCIMLTAHALTPGHLAKAIEEHAALYLPKEEIHELEMFLCEVLSAPRKASFWSWLAEKIDFRKHFGLDEIPTFREDAAELRDDPLLFLERVYEDCGDVGQVRVGPVPIVFVSSAELARWVLVEKAQLFGPVRELDQILRTSGAKSNGGPPPPVPAGVLPAWVGATREEAERVARNWAPGATVDLEAEVRRVTLAVAARGLFGVRPDDDTLARIAAAVPEVQRRAHDKLTSSVRIPLRWPTLGNRRLRGAVAGIEREVLPLANAGGAELLSWLMAARGGDAADEAIAFLAADCERIVTAATLCWHLLWQNPDVERLLRAELETALGGRGPTFDDLAWLPYARAVVREVLRLYPPASVVLRETTGNAPLGRHGLRAGAWVGVNVHAIQRRSDYFPDPVRFAPQRFLDDAARARPGAFLPFGAGARAALVTELAVAQVQTMLATLLPGVALTTREDESLDLDLLLSLRLTHGLRMRVRRPA